MRKGPLDEAQIFFDPSSSQSDAKGLSTWEENNTAERGTFQILF